MNDRMCYFFQFVSGAGWGLGLIGPFSGAGGDVRVYSKYCAKLNPKRYSKYLWNKTASTDEYYSWRVSGLTYKISTGKCYEAKHDSALQAIMIKFLEICSVFFPSPL